MNNAFKIVLVSISILALSCHDNINQSANNSSMVVQTENLFVGQSMEIPMTLDTDIEYGDDPSFDEWWFDSFAVGISYTQKKNEIKLRVHALKVSPGIITRIISFTHAGKKYYQQVSVNVIDFYYVSSFSKNAGDTLNLKKGTNYLLKVTCKDSAGNIVPRSIFSAMGLGGIGYGING
ncbi:MAG: hypothetical protein KA247_01110 [Bacteroidetes bacterium]|nr:hypothetical protein [Bacteroidota bacterium]